MAKWQEKYVENWWNAIRIQYVVILISAFSEVEMSWRSWCDCCEIIVRINDVHRNPAQNILRLHVYKYSDWNDYRKLLLVWIWEPDETFALVFEILHDALAGSKCTADDIHINGRYATIHLHLQSRLDRAHTELYNTMLCQCTYTSVTHMIQGKMSQVRRGLHKQMLQACGQCL